MRCIASIGIDSWAVDYGLLDARGDLVGTPFCYRDARTSTGVERVHAVVSPAELYAVNGLQFLPFNTLYQLAAEQGTPRWDNARTVLLIPDLLGYWLTGEIGAEWTNATTTGLVDAASRAWSSDLAERLDIPQSLLPPLRQPGDRLGTLLPSVVEATGLPASTPVVAVGSHDTASAVAAVPAAGDRFAYISSGTWSLVGVELPAPVLSEASRVANFTNEGGVDGTTRYLRNVMGLWLLNECLRTWERAGSPTDLARLLVAAATCPTEVRSSTPTTPCSSRPGTCRPGSPTRADGPASRCRRTGPRSYAASSTAWPRSTLARSTTAAGSPGGTSTRCTSSVAVQTTPCCAASPRGQRSCPWSPDRSRRPRWATSSSRPEQWEPSLGTCQHCVGWSVTLPSVRQAQQISTVISNRLRF